MRLIDVDKLIDRLRPMYELSMGIQEKVLCSFSIGDVISLLESEPVVKQTAEIEDDLIYRKDAIAAMYDAASPLARMWTGDAIRALKSIPRVDPMGEVIE